MNDMALIAREAQALAGFFTYNGERGDFVVGQGTAARTERLLSKMAEMGEALSLITVADTAEAIASVQRLGQAVIDETPEDSHPAIWEDIDAAEAIIRPVQTVLLIGERRG